MFTDWKNLGVCVSSALLLAVCFDAANHSAGTNSSILSSCCAAAPAKGAKLSKDQVALAKAWSSFYGGKYAEVSKILPPLLKSRQEAIRVEARHIAARMFWARGNAKNRARAQRVWKILKKRSTLNVNLKRLMIAEALKLEADSQTAQAVEKLEALLQGGYQATCTPEAAILLAELEAGRGNRKKAILACKFAINFSRQLTRGGETLPYASVKPFIDAARQLREKQRNLKKRDETDPAELAFKEAEKLRKSRKYPEAVKAFRTVIKRYEASDWAHHSGYAMGLCLKDKGDLRNAIKWWRKFIDELPTGPWRGQAYLEVIDASLEHGLNIGIAITYARRAAEGLSAAENNEKTAASWKLVAVDLHLRVGLLSYINGDYDQAVRSLTAAREAAGKKFRKSTIDGLSRLIAAAEEKKPVIPADVLTFEPTDKGGEGKEESDAHKKLSRPAAVLAMGTIYNITGRLNQAERIFKLVLSGPSTGSGRTKAGKATAAQKSYAEYGLAVTAQGRGQLVKAQKHYLASLNAYKKGSWHDETLYQLATVAMNEAKSNLKEMRKELEAAKHAPVPVLEGSEKKSSKPDSSVGSGQAPRHSSGQAKGRSKSKDKYRKSKKPARPKSPTQLLAEREKVKADQLPIWSKALGYWRQLADRYPASRHIQAARYNVGVIYFEVAQSKKGAAALEKLVADNPKSPFAGESLLLLGRYALEYVVDPVLARKYFTQLDKWADEVRESAQVSADVPKDPAEIAKNKDQEPPKEGEIKRVYLGDRPRQERRTFDSQMLTKCYACDWYLDGLQGQCARFLGFLHFVAGEKEKALEQYNRLASLDPEVSRTKCNDLNRLRWGAEHGYMYAYPQELKPFEGRQRLGVMLADFYFFTLQFDKSAVMVRRLLKGEFGPLHGAAREYPQYLYAECIYWTIGREAAVPEYIKVFGSFQALKGKDVSYTKDRAAYAAANVASASLKNSKLRKQGLAFMKQLAFSGRKNEHAYKARVGYAILLFRAKEHAKAIRLLKTFPADAGEWKTIANRYLKTLREIARKKKG